MPELSPVDGYVHEHRTPSRFENQPRDFMSGDERQPHRVLWHRTYSCGQRRNEINSAIGLSPRQSMPRLTGMRALLLVYMLLRWSLLASGE